MGSPQQLVIAGNASWALSIFLTGTEASAVPCSSRAIRGRGGAGAAMLMRGTTICLRGGTPRGWNSGTQEKVRAAVVSTRAGEGSG